jgi:hypothetical protein
MKLLPFKELKLDYRKNKGLGTGNSFTEDRVFLDLFKNSF